VVGDEATIRAAVERPIGRRPDWPRGAVTAPASTHGSIAAGRARPAVPPVLIASEPARANGARSA
jgi:hypothetical protein